MAAYCQFWLLSFVYPAILRLTDVHCYRQLLFSAMAGKSCLGKDKGSLGPYYTETEQIYFLWVLRCYKNLNLLLMVLQSLLKINRFA